MTDEDWKGESKLRGIKAPRGDGAGHNFGKSKVNKLARGETIQAPAHPDFCEYCAQPVGWPHFMDCPNG